VPVRLSQGTDECESCGPIGSPRHLYFLPCGRDRLGRVDARSGEISCLNCDSCCWWWPVAAPPATTAQGGLPASIQRRKTATRSGGQAPSQGIVPASRRSRMASAWVETSSGDQRRRRNASSRGRGGCPTAGGQEATRRAPVGEVLSERVGHGRGRAVGDCERAGDVVRRAGGDSGAEARGVTQALLEQRPGRFPMGQEVVVLVEELEARADKTTATTAQAAPAQPGRSPSDRVRR
jgi:hypothetical protein